MGLIVFVRGNRIRDLIKIDLKFSLFEAIISVMENLMVTQEFS